MADIIDLSKYRREKNRHKLETEAEMSKIIDLMENTIQKCKEGLVDIPESVNSLEYAISAMPPESIDLEAERGNRPMYIEESKRITSAIMSMVIVKIAKLSETLDKKGLYKEADMLDKILYSSGADHG